MWRVKDQIEQLVLAEIDPDGSTLQHALETVPEHDANSLSVNQLAHTVCNQEHARVE